MTPWFVEFYSPAGMKQVAEYKSEGDARACFRKAEKATARLKITDDRKFEFLIPMADTVVILVPPKMSERIGQIHAMQQGTPVMPGSSH